MFVTHLPIPSKEINRLGKLLKSKSVFVPTFSKRNPYNFKLYLEQEGLFQAQTILLLDNNVYARAAKLARGGRATSEDRIPAAVMAFAHCARLITAPAFALYESSDSRERFDALQDLAYFQAADDLHPSEWSDIAFGNSDRLRTQVRHRPYISADFSARLSVFGFAYPHVLMMSLIQLAGGNKSERMSAYMRWCHARWLFSAPASLLAARVFSSTPPAGAQKDLRNADRLQALRGVRNATWDLVFLYGYKKAYDGRDEKNELTVACSMDRLLLDIAMDLRRSYSGTNVLKRRIEAEYGPQVSALSTSLTRKKRSPKRMYESNDEYILPLRAKLEEAFVSWPVSKLNLAQLQNF